jgi:oxidoreductase
MTNGEPLRVAVVGLGWAGRSIWLPRLREHPAYVVAAAVDPVLPARASAASVLGDVPVYSTVDALSPDSVDLAIVAVPNHLHSEVAGRLLASGVPVFLEKPVCLSSAEADRLAEAEKTGGAVLLAGSAARYRTDVRQLYELAGKVGRVRHVDVAWVRARGVPDTGGWFTSRQLAGGGALVDLGWHLLDTLGPLLGSSTFVQVVGTVSDDFVNSPAWRAAWRHDEDPATATRGDVEDTARGFMTSTTGISVSLRASWASHEACDTTLIKVEGSASTATLVCTFGFSPNRRDGSTLTLTRDGATEVVAVPDDPIGSEYRRQLDELPAMLADPAAMGLAIEEARPTVQIIERLYESARRPTVAPVSV